MCSTRRRPKSASSSTPTKTSLSVRYTGTCSVLGAAGGALPRQACARFQLWSGLVLCMWIDTSSAPPAHPPTHPPTAGSAKTARLLREGYERLATQTHPDPYIKVPPSGSYNHRPLFPPHPPLPVPLHPVGDPALHAGRVAVHAQPSHPPRGSVP